MSKKIILCNCESEIIQKSRLQLIEDYVKNEDAEIIKISDICGLVAIDKEQLHTVFNDGNEYLIIGCYSRSIKLLLEQAAIDVTQLPIVFINFIELTNEQIFNEISAFTLHNCSENSFRETKPTTQWLSWYPIIDYSRCIACGQCADFCLFGVYQKTKERVSVLNPQSCKTNCPACARICPNTAILFPKYKNGGAISGSDTKDEAEEQKRFVMDVDNFLGGDIYSALEFRKTKRQSIIRNEAFKKANDERDNALREKGKL